MQHELPKSLTPEHRELVNDLFDWLIEPCIDFIRHNCKMILNASHSHLVFTLMRFYTCQLDEIIEAGKQMETEDGEEAVATLTPSQVNTLESAHFTYLTRLVLFVTSMFTFS